MPQESTVFFDVSKLTSFNESGEKKLANFKEDAT